MLIHELSNHVREGHLTKMIDDDGDDLADDHVEPLPAYMSLDYDNH